MDCGRRKDEWKHWGIVECLSAQHQPSAGRLHGGHAAAPQSIINTQSWVSLPTAITASPRALETLCDNFPSLCFLWIRLICLWGSSQTWQPLYCLQMNNRPKPIFKNQSCTVHEIPYFRIFTTDSRHTDVNIAISCKVVYVTTQFKVSGIEDVLIELNQLAIMYEVIILFSCVLTVECL